MWISRNEEDKLQNQSRNENIKSVSDLIEEVNRIWKTDLIVNTFTADIARKIMQIPLTSTVHEDFQVWRGEPFDNFSVRSVYKLLQEATLDPIWKISWNYIPTFANIKHKRVVVEARCPRCRQHEEDSNHVLW
ncbi:Ribonuclease H-like superfamily protein [Gossypium australe]|uniref:Ribonuclease H-like superfamily protein n=1 Tax=Gossypium australe TaxID=47621 RepID=A0A5B6WYW4_9ROSI|nr:Ribonuclease H-like superfamily protein [Gossypium australe]